MHHDPCIPQVLLHGSEVYISWICYPDDRITPLSRMYWIEKP